MSEEGSEGSPPRPVRRRIRKVMVVSSTSDSDSDWSVAPLGTRRKRLRVLSDDGGESSGSSVVARRKRTLRALRDSEAESDSSGWATDPSEGRTSAAAPKKQSGFSSDSSEGNSDKCSICLLRFRDQEVGIPEACEHMFCLDCITEWSKNVNTCPVDRMVFNSITVRICAGGRVLRTEPVKVTERRPSVDIFVVEDPTPCEICGSTSNEESMLLCDGCDLGYHMQCLTPPLTEVPIDQWLCPNCDDLLDDVIDIPADLLSLAGFDVDVPFARRHRALSGHRASVSDEPSTSTGRATEPSTSRGSRGQRSGRRSNAPTRSRASKRRTRRPRTVVVEYELEGGGKLPVTRRVKRRIKKRKTGRKQRTAARRSHVRASVRAKLASHLPTIDRSQLSSAPLAELAINRQRAAIPTLSLFDSPGLEYFSDDCDVSEGALSAITAVARPTSSVLNAYRQARRKIVSIPSPPHASSAPDLLSSILDSQTLLHSKRSVVSITVDGKVDIKLESRRKIDPKKSEDATRKAPSYPGQGRTGGWGGGYRGNYHRENPTGNFSRGYDYSQATPRPLLQNPGPGPHGNEEHNNYDRRPQHYNDERFDRRRQENRNFRPEGRLSGPSWQSFGPRPQRPEPPARHSFGGFENPLDMRMTQPSAPNNYQEAPNNFRQEPSNNFHQEPQNNFRQEPNNFRQEPNNFRQEPLPRQEPNFRQEQNIPEEPPQRFQPLPEPPSFKFDRPPEIEKSEDEKSDPGLVIDTEKYDPMEPTNDESGDDEPQVISCPPPPPAPPLLQNVLASIDTSAINVSAEVLDDAVRHVIQEHRNLIMPSIAPAASDDESDGDCPNFSIYSATSVHIAEIPRETPPLRNVIQETDDIPMPHPESPQDDIESPSSAEIPEKITEVRSKEQEYKEKVSKRCPITTNPRNPIKIKINTPSLIKRVSLYDEDVPDVEEPQEEKSSNESVEKQKDSPKDKDRDSPSKSVVKANEDEEKDDEDIEENVEEDDAVEGTPPNLYEDEPLAEVNGEVMTKTDDDQDKDEEDKEPVDKDSKDEQSDDDTSEKELQVHKETTPDKVDESVEKMTESISETEDERSYTPCLDENKSKDTSLETEKEKGIEGLDTEMISEEEGNGIFSDNERAKSPAQPVVEEPAKKKKKKESKNKEKSKTKIKKSDVTFKKLSKSGKERNYRDKDKDKEDKKSKKERRSSGSGEERRARRREKRKDLERYDVRTLVTERRRRGKDAFGRDVSPPRDAFGSPPDEAGSPRKRSASRSASRKRSVSLRRRTISPRRRSISRRKSVTPRRKTISPRRRSLTPRRRSVTPRKRSLTPRRRSISPRRRSISRKRSISPKRISPRRKSGSVRRRSISPRRKSLTPRRKSISPRRKSVSPRRKSPSPRRRSGSRGRKTAARRKRSTSRPRKRVRRSASKSPKPKAKKKKRARSPPRRSPRKKKRVVVEWSPDRARTPPAPRRHRPPIRGPSKEVFTSGDNILVSVSFKDQERDRDPSDKRKRKEKRSEKRRKRKRAMVPDIESSKPVAIIDLERSPFREITPSPKNVIVLSDSDHGGKETVGPPVAPAPEPEAFPVGPKTPPEPATVKFTLAVKPAAPRPPNPLREEEQPPAAPAGPTTPPGSPDAYDPFEPTRSPSPAAVQDPPHLITLETAQKTNMSADDVIDRRPISPMEKVMALLQSTRDVSPEPPPQPASQVAAEAVVSTPAPTQTPTQTAVAPAPRIVLPSPTRSQAPKLFLAKPSPIKSNPVKPMQATKISRLPLPTPRRPLPEIEHSPGADSPYSPGSSDFGDLFSPPGAPPAAQASAPKGKQNVFDALFDKPPKKKGRSSAAKVPVKLNKKKGKTQVGVKIDEDNLKILDDLPSSAVEMQVKSKFLKKLNRQERVVEEVKLVLKPHYNKKHVTKEEYKDILRRCVPKICHNKSGEINPTKIQALVEAYVRKYRKKHKMAAS